VVALVAAVAFVDSAGAVDSVGAAEAVGWSVSVGTAAEVLPVGLEDSPAEVEGTTILVGAVVAEVSAGVLGLLPQPESVSIANTNKMALHLMSQCFLFIKIPFLCG
jgi:hypothetical protein